MPSLFEHQSKRKMAEANSSMVAKGANPEDIMAKGISYTYNFLIRGDPLLPDE